MATIFEPAPQEAVELLQKLIEVYRFDLKENGARICLLFAHSTSAMKPALTHGSQTVAGWCQVHGYPERVQGKADATICVDGDRWPKWSAERRAALLHHELSHIAFCAGKRDALERPILQAKRGDWNHDGFYEVVKLYGAHSFEWSNLRVIAEEVRQLDLPFLNAPAAGEDPEEAATAPLVPPERREDAA